MNRLSESVKFTIIRQYSNRIALICSAIVAVLSILVMTGWITGVHSLASLGSGSIPQAPASALAFTLLGSTWFFYLHKPSRRSARIGVLASALFVLLVALLNLIRFSTGVNAIIEEFLISRILVIESGIYGADPMSPITAVSFLLSSAAMILSLTYVHRKEGLSGGFASIVTLVNLVVLLGYLYGTPLLYGGEIRPVSLPTGISFVFLSAGLIATSGPGHFPLRLLAGPSMRALLLRYFLLVILIFVLAHAVIYNLFSQLIMNAALRTALAVLVAVAVNSAIVLQLSRVIGGAIEREETERKLMENALLESEKKFRSIVEQSGDGIVLTNEQGIIIEWNQAEEQIIGMKRAEAIGRPIWDVQFQMAPLEKKTPEAYEMLKANMLELIMTGRSQWLNRLWENDIQHSDGTRRSIQVLIFLIKTGKGWKAGSISRNITERKKLELALQESEKKYHGLYDSIKDGIVLTDLSGRILECNQTYLNMLGYTQEEIRGITYQQLTPVKWHEMEARIKQQILKRGYSDEYEKEYIKKDGTIFPVSLRIWLIKNEPGEPVGMWGIVRDITERKHAGERLQHRIDMEKLIASISTRFINLSLDEIDSAINHTLKTIGEFDDVDRSYMFLFYDSGTKMDNTHEWCAEGIKTQIQNLKGLSVDDFTWLTQRLRKFETIYIPSVADLPPEAHAEAEHFQIQDIKSLLVVPMVSGTSLIGFLGFDSVRTIKTWLEEDVRLLKIVGEIFINALKRKQAEEELNQRSQLAALGAEVGIALTRGDTLRDILQRCTEAIVQYLDAALARIWTLNEAENFLKLQASAGIYTHIDGFHSRVPIGSFKIGLIAKERKPHMTNSVIGDPRIHDQEWAKREGMIAFAGYPLIVQDRLVGVMAMFARQPLTDFALKALASVADSIALGIERKQTEEAIKRYARELEESNRMKELFIDIMHHDLINPLTAASSYIQLLQEEQIYLNKKVCLEGAERSLVRAHELIENATTFSKLRSLKSIDFESMDLKEVIERVVENFALLTSRTGMVIQNNITYSMPVSGNKMIEDVFANLISNAVKYAPNGKRIIIDSMDVGELWRIRVIDFGEGIHDADKSRIFDRFLRAEKKGVKGSGLGLAIAERIVQLHRGRIWVEDNPKGGSIFVVEIPKNIEDAKNKGF